MLHAEDSAHAEALHDDLRVETLFNKRLHLHDQNSQMSAANVHTNTKPLKTRQMCQQKEPA
jgi:hypothetical protein